MDSLERFICTLPQPGTKTSAKTITSAQVAQIFGTKDGITDAMAKVAADAGAFLDRFAGTPLYDQAKALCDEELKLEAEDIQRRLARRNEDQNDIWLQRDEVCLKKKQLEVQLHAHMNQQAAAPAGVDPTAAGQGAAQPAAANPAMPAAEVAPVGVKVSYAIARACSPADSDCEPSFLDRFVGTPLYEQAAALAQEELAIEEARVAQSMREAEARAADNSYEKQELIRLQKQKLELQLHGITAGQATEPALAAAAPKTAAFLAGHEQEKLASKGSDAAKVIKDPKAWLAKTKNKMHAGIEQDRKGFAALDARIRDATAPIPRPDTDVDKHMKGMLAGSAVGTVGAAAYLHHRRKKQSAIDLGALAAKAKPGLGSLRRSIPQQAAAAGKAMPPPVPAMATHDVFRSPKALSFGKGPGPSKAPVKTIPFHQQPKEMQQHAEGLHMLSERAAKGDAQTRANTLNLAKRMGVHGDVSAAVLAHDKGLSKFAGLRAYARRAAG